MNIDFIILISCQEKNKFFYFIVIIVKINIMPYKKRRFISSQKKI